MKTDPATSTGAELTCMSPCQRRGDQGDGEAHSGLYRYTTRPDVTRASASCMHMAIARAYTTTTT